MKYLNEKNCNNSADERIEKTKIFTFNHKKNTVKELVKLKVIISHL